jgi:hypothetical protein
LSEVKTSIPILALVASVTLISTQVATEAANVSEAMRDFSRTAGADADRYQAGQYPVLFGERKFWPEYLGHHPEAGAVNNSTSQKYDWANI